MADTDLDPPFEIDKSPSPKQPKEKKIKRPSDFEITRTLLQRIHDRKLPFLLKDAGEDSDVLMLCSESEKGFTYGSSDMAVCLFQCTDPVLQTLIDSFLSKCNGYHNQTSFQRVVNLRDQFSELAKTKGDSIDLEVKSNSRGDYWTHRTDKNGKKSIFYLCKTVESLYHMQQVSSWCAKYKALLDGENPEHAYYPFTYQSDKTASIVTLPPPTGNHPLANLYPQGFRFLATKGADVLLSKCLSDFPYPVLSEELIVFTHQSYCVQIAHRIIGDGWRCVLVRPNAVCFPTSRIYLPPAESHLL